VVREAGGKRKTKLIARPGQSSSRRTVWRALFLCGVVLRLFRKIPKIGTAEKFDTDLTPALSVVVAVDNACPLA
jgi:hypothetical protein